MEASANNVLGTNNLLRAALNHGVENFVMISTNKAVNPTSVMGASKRCAELLVLEAARNSGRAFVVVRLGNVLGGRGSIVPIFKRQIAAGGPVTVSDVEMTSYVMTIPEAVQLTLQAAVLGRGGEVYMLDMGMPVRIVDLARDLIRLSDLEAGRDIDIVYTGLRPGEKLYEELFAPGEHYQPTRHEKILLAANAASRIPDMLAHSVANLENAVASGQREVVLRSLNCLIPEFQPDEVRRDAVTVRQRAMTRAVEAPYNCLSIPIER
jgi:FlaA1/EpsC-like NDP-sugar epimerase